MCKPSNVPAVGSQVQYTIDDVKDLHDNNLWSSVLGRDWQLTSVPIVEKHYEH